MSKKRRNVKQKQKCKDAKMLHGKREQQERRQQPSKMAAAQVGIAGSNRVSISIDAQYNLSFSVSPFLSLFICFFLSFFSSNPLTKSFNLLSTNCFVLISETQKEAQMSTI